MREDLSPGDAVLITNWDVIGIVVEIYNDYIKVFCKSPDSILPDFCFKDADYLQKIEVFTGVRLA